MKEVVLTDLGFFTVKDCENIKKIMDGKTYMNFRVAWSNHAGNCTLIVRTDCDDEIEHFFSFRCIGGIGKKGVR